MDTQDIIKLVTQAVVKQLQQENNEIYQSSCPTFNNKDKNQIPLGVSNRHVHLCQSDLHILFGQGYQLTNYKDLSQPGQFACQEKVTIVGPKGVIENVRILGPERNKTQVELSNADCMKLGIKAPLRDSGDLEGSGAITLVGPKGSVTINEGAIIAARHIHMHTNDASTYCLKDGDRVSVKVSGPRSLIFNQVLVRVSDKYKLEMHIDYDEANAAFLTNNDFVEIQKK